MTETTTAPEKKRTLDWWGICEKAVPSLAVIFIVYLTGLIGGSVSFFTPADRAALDSNTKAVLQLSRQVARVQTDLDAIKAHMVEADSRWITSTRIHEDHERRLTIMETREEMRRGKFSVFHALCRRLYAILPDKLKIPKPPRKA